LEAIRKKGVRLEPDVSALASTEGGTLRVLVRHFHEGDLPGPPAELTLSCPVVALIYAQSSTFPREIFQRRSQISGKDSVPRTVGQSAPLAIRSGCVWVIAVSVTGFRSPL
jgi:hypothetical protein